MLIPRLASKIHTVTAIDRTQHILNGVKLERLPGGLARASASDGRRLLAIEWIDADVAREYPSACGCDPTPVAGFSTVLSGKALGETFKAIPKRAIKPILECVALEEISANGSVKLGSTDTETSRFSTMRSLEGQYPDVDQAIPPMSNMMFSIAVNPELLIGLLQAMLPASSDYSPSVLLSFSQADRAMRIDSCCASLGHAIGVLMPMSLDLSDYEWKPTPIEPAKPAEEAQEASPAPQDATPAEESIETRCSGVCSCHDETQADAVMLARKGGICSACGCRWPEPASSDSADVPETWDEQSGVIVSEMLASDDAPAYTMSTGTREDEIVNVMEVRPEPAVKKWGMK